jgi:DNA polymerase
MTAATAVLGPGLRMNDLRGRFIETDYCEKTVVTWHPSAILRSHDGAARDEKMQQLTSDLAMARQ